MSDSEPLTTLMASGPMPVEDVIRIGRDAAAALAPSVHGELWPSAIAVSDDTIGLVPPGTADRSRYGQYAAPERILGKPATSASDVFSLAAILFHALAGRPAFRGSSPAEIMLAVCADVPLDLHSLRSDVPRELSSLLQRALSRDPGQRPTAVAFREALVRLLHKDRWPGRRVLAADDEAEIRELYSQLAARIGVEMDVVASGRDAVEALKTRKYDVAMLDLNMPRLSGWEVLDFLRTRYEMRPRCLFIITGFSDQRISEADREVVTAVLYKPVASEELRELVTACLRGGQVDPPSILRTTGHRILRAG